MTVRSRKATVGDVAPDFTLTDQAGIPFHLVEALSGDAVVLVFLRGFS